MKKYEYILLYCYLFKTFRRMSGGLSEREEDQLLDDMDHYWYRMSSKERNIVEKIIRIVQEEINE